MKRLLSFFRRRPVAATAEIDTMAAIVENAIEACATFDETKNVEAFLRDNLLDRYPGNKHALAMAAGLRMKIGAKRAMIIASVLSIHGLTKLRKAQRN